MSDDSAGPVSAPTALNRAGIIAGFGLRERAGLADVLTLLDASLVIAGYARSDVVALTTLETKKRHPALVSAARLLNVPILSLQAHQLDQQAPNPSERVFALVDVPSVAEAAALSFGPLVVEKQHSANVTCALSYYEPAVAAPRSSASMAPSTLATSSAGP